MGNESQVKYFAKGTQPDRDTGGLFEPFSRSFDYLDWIARLTSHVPEKGMQLTHYFGVYSNVYRGKAAKAHSMPGYGVMVESVPAESEEDWIKKRRNTWARLIKRVFEADPLLCECGSILKVISVIEARAQPNLVAKILKHIKFHFDVLQLPSRSPLPVPFDSPDPQPDFSHSYYL